MLVFDFEVFMYDWLVVFKDISTGKYEIIINDEEKLRQFYTSHQNSIYVGYNNKAFDNVVFDGVLSGVEPYTVMKMLFAGVTPYKVRKTCQITPLNITNIDLMQDILGMSLKEAEGFMNMSIEESSVPFDIERRLTQEEIEETIFYCKHDVDATEKLLTYRKSYVQSKMELIRLFGLSIKDLELTNAMLCAKILKAKPVDRNDEMTYDMPKEVQITNPKYLPIQQLYTRGQLDYNNTLDICLAGVMHKFAYGGVHGAIENFVYKGEMWNIDMTSYYPSMMIRFGFLSRNTPSLLDFKNIYDSRVMAKHLEEFLKADAYKLVLNTTYGCMKSKFNPLYDPKMANQVCITGQLLFVDLIEKLEPYITLVQTNTDGILVIPKNKDKIMEILKQWETRTGLSSDIDICKGIWQKDVNNYIMIINKKGKDKIKVKGAYVAQYDGSGLKNSNRICDIAVVDYFVKGISPEETIGKATDKYLFQIITKTGGTYSETEWMSDKGIVKVNKVNRVYASKNFQFGKLFKIKYLEKIRRDSIANLPEHCYVDNKDILDIKDIDRKWYIDMAWKRITDFIGGKNEKNGYI